MPVQGGLLLVVFQPNSGLLAVKVKRFICRQPLFVQLLKTRAGALVLFSMQRMALYFVSLELIVRFDKQFTNLIERGKRCRERTGSVPLRRRRL
jgi:hypothetical protein